MSGDFVLIGSDEGGEEHLFDILDRTGVFKKSNYALLRKECDSKEQIAITEEMQKNVTLLIDCITTNPCEGVFRISCRSEEINQVLRNLPNLPSSLDPIIAACCLKLIWRNAQLVPKLYYFPILRSLHISSTLKRIEMIKKVLSMFDHNRRLLIHQMALVAKDLVDTGVTKLDHQGMAVLLGPVLFSQTSRPTVKLDIPQELDVRCNDDEDVKNGHGNGPQGSINDADFERNLIIKEVDWMNELFLFMIKHEQRIFTDE